MRVFLSVIFLFSSIYVQAQTRVFEISGNLISMEDNFPLESATVYLERESDSTVVTYDISDVDGAFNLEGRSSDKHLKLYISYIGYKKHSQILDVTQKVIELGNIALETDDHVLDEVIIKSTPPITIKKDTLEFNAASFKTRKDANIEDLLKELPGVEVDNDGAVVINGKPIDKILVNGKPFFGDDPTIALRNLTKDIIKSLQFTDTKTKDEAFAGEAGSSTTKTLNLVIKKDRNKGVFGRVASGAGTNKRYEYAGMLNRFNGEQRLSILAGGNNVNSPGFSFGEIKKMFGGNVNASNFGAGQGVVTSNNIGLNYSDGLGQSTDLNSNYFHSKSDSENSSTRSREYILANGKYFTNNNSNSINSNNNHKINLGYNIRLDSTLLINVSPSFRYAKNEQRTVRSNEALNEDLSLTNQSHSAAYLINNSKNFANRLGVTKRFGSNGAFFKLNVSSSINASNTDNLLNSETFIYGDTPSSIIRNQEIETTNMSHGNSVYATYRMPIKAKELFLDFKYSFSKNKGKNVKSTYDFDATSQEFNDFNANLSKSFEFENQTSSPSIKFSYRKEKWSTSFQTKYVIKTLENQDFLRPEFSLARQFKNLEHQYRLDYRFNAKSRFEFGYDLINNEPALSRLQEFEDATNPLNIIVGNPNLKVSNNHSLNINYKIFNFQRKRNFYIYVNMNFDENESVAKVTIDDNLVKHTTFENVNGNYRISGRMSYRKEMTIDDKRIFRIGAGLGANLRKRINYNNDVKYASLVKAISPGFGLRFRWKEVMEINPNYTISITKTSYDIDRFNDREMLFHAINIRSAVFVPKNMEWRNDIAFRYDANIADGFQKSAWFWNTTLSYAVLKDQGLITLKAYDLLNQNTNARRLVTDDYIEDATSTVLQQYFMLSFSWRFNSFKKNQEV